MATLQGFDLAAELAKVRAVNLLSAVLTLPMAMAASAATHYLASRAVKAVMWSVSPLSTGEPQAFNYERNVYFTADAGAMQVVAAVLVAGVVVWLGGVTGWAWLDPLVAVAVALNIVREGGRMIWRSVQGLMDMAVEPEVQTRIDAVLAGFAATEHGGGVLRFDHVLTRKAGQRRFVMHGRGNGGMFGWR